MTAERVDRFELQFEHFQKSLARLKEALAEDETSFVRDSIIKRFEVTFEMAWKTMFRFLVDKGERIAISAFVRSDAVLAFDRLQAEMLNRT